MRVGVVVMVLGLVACTKPNPNRCCTDQADCDANGIPMGTACGSGLVCRGNQCIAEGCTASAECDAAAPYCDGQTCTEQCTADTECPGFAQDTSAIYCVSGACEQCRSDADCSASAPTCDMGVCHGCVTHSDCASALCDIDTSTCIPESAVIYADPSGSTSSDCTMSAPCSFEHAFSVVSATRNAIKLAPGTYMNSGASVTGPNTVTVYGPATINGGVGIQSVDGGTLRVRDLVSNGGMACSASQTNLPMSHLDLERVTFGDNSVLYLSPCELQMRQVTQRVTSNTIGSPISASGEPAGVGGATMDRPTTIVMDRCRIEGGDPAIVATSLATFQITNTIFANQGTSYGAVQLANDKLTTSTISFSTFFNSLVKCPVVAGNGGFASSDNIIVYQGGGAPTDTATGTYCTHSYDLVKPQSSSLSGVGNILNVDPKLANPSIGDFHLLVGSPAIDAADPNATLDTDYDGITRPQGTARDIGALEYKP